MNQPALKKFASQANPTTLEALRSIARKEGRHFQAILEEAMLEYIEHRSSHNARSLVMKNFEKSVKKNRRLAELLAK